MKKELLFVIPAIILALLTGAGFKAAVAHLAVQVGPLRLGVPWLSNYRELADITYCQAGGNPQKLDLYIPERRSDERLPLVVYVHGGSWLGGDKANELTPQYLPWLARTGFVVAAINYRLAPEFTFPAQIEDTKCALRYLRAHAEEYGIDKNKAGIIGESAGGYLAAFAGATGDMPDFVTAEQAGESDKVQAVISIAGPADFTGSETLAAGNRIVRQFLGAASPAAASPVTYVTADDPPYLLIHGAEDRVVPLAQSESLHAALLSAGAPSELVVVSNAGHAINEATAANLTPSLSEVAAKIVEFFTNTLR